ncbi:MAG: DUF1963 domain-containing protein [Pirellulaceae bacterium]
MSIPNSKRRFVGLGPTGLGTIREYFDTSAMYVEPETPRELEWHGLDLVSNHNAPTRSHFRGLPELDEGCPWPVIDQTPLELVACIHLSEMAAAKNYPVDFPRTGVLNLFCFDGVVCRVVYARTAGPRVAAPSSLVIREAVPISTIEGGPLQEGWAKVGAKRHRFGGLPELVQSTDKPIPNLTLHLDSGRFMNDPTVVAELERANVMAQDIKWRRPHAAKQLDAMGVDPIIFGRGVERWRLLLQIDSDVDLGFCWGDEGRIYVFIPEVSLAAQKLEDAYGHIECY